ncbi:uncharacterized protein B0H18DRAFT_951037 [Fomitopsis serialis]|uniref:uncharacterized protein n=1 Tax=Fomitopsis serialis TaxID=139415 RepID=UPI0020078B92|nr:uncharacterized protein B0H18DRAFT_951037 [Neoantrodia serialis]KAH9935508.1 hypothetical protein B0H18DRAFT_951037 [Neoantrodia serialis]
MGLSGENKQRIGADPRNLTWANDASKFGSAYLEKFGWASGSGLGASGEGRTNHISVYQKLDMLGIGADHKNNQDGTAWKQGKDFENLLRRLNAAAGQEEGAADVPKIDGFVKPTAPAEENVRAAEEEGAPSSETKSATINVVSETTVAARAPVIVPRPVRAHRARHIAMKGMASKSATAIAEILGVPSSSVPTPSLSDSPDPSASSSALDTPASGPAALKMQDLTTSNKSVMDYFRDKLAAKSNRASDSSTPASAEMPTSDDYDERPRGGLGLGASRLRVETVEVEDYDDRPRGGLGSSKLAVSMSAMSFVQSATQVEEEGTEKNEQPLGNEHSPSTRKSKKRKHREEGVGDSLGTKHDSDEGFSPSVVKKDKLSQIAPTSADGGAQNQEPKTQKRRTKKNETADQSGGVAVVEEKSRKRKKKREAEDASQ